MRCVAAVTLHGAPPRPSSQHRDRAGRGHATVSKCGYQPSLNAYYWPPRRARYSRHSRLPKPRRALVQLVPLGGLAWRQYIHRTRRPLHNAQPKPRSRTRQHCDSALWPLALSFARHTAPMLPADVALRSIVLPVVPMSAFVRCRCSPHYPTSARLCTSVRRRKSWNQTLSCDFSACRASHTVVALRFADRELIYERLLIRRVHLQPV